MGLEPDALTVDCTDVVRQATMRDPEGNGCSVLRGPEDGWTPDEL